MYDWQSLHPRGEPNPNELDDWLGQLKQTEEHRRRATKKGSIYMGNDEVATSKSGPTSRSVYLKRAAATRYSEWESDGWSYEQTGTKMEPNNWQLVARVERPQALHAVSARFSWSER